MQFTEYNENRTKVAVVSDDRYILEDARHYWEQRGYELAGCTTVERDGEVYGCVKLELRRQLEAERKVQRITPVKRLTS